MTADTENLILEHLRHIRARIDAMSLDIVDVKARLSAMDENLALIRADTAHLHSMYANQGKRIDRIEERLGRIERRLELAEEPQR